MSLAPLRSTMPTVAFGRGSDARAAAGEFRHPSTIAVGSDDRILVANGPTVQVLGPQRGLLETRRTPGVASELLGLPDGRLLGHVRSARRGEPTLFLSAHPDSAPFIFGADASGQRFSGLREIAVRRHEIWSVGKVRLDLQRFSMDGERLEVHQLEHPWFRDDLSSGEIGSVRVSDAVFGPGDLLWVLVLRQRADWTPPRPAGGDEARPVSLTPQQWQDRWQQRLDAIAVDAGRIVATRIIEEEAMGGFVGPGRLYGYTERDSGVQITIWRMDLQTNGASPHQDSSEVPLDTTGGGSF